MKEFVEFATQIKELGSTVLIVCAAIWFGFRYLPNQMKQQGKLDEILRNNTAVIENCTEVLRMVSVKDDKNTETLNQCNQNIENIKNAQHAILRDLRNNTK